MFGGMFLNMVRQIRGVYGQQFVFPDKNRHARVASRGKES